MNTQFTIRLKHIACGLCLFFFAIACGVSQDFQVTTADKERVWQRRSTLVTVEELKEGYKLYVSNCGNCHNLIVPSKYSTAEWSTYLNPEFTKAKVTDFDVKLKITNYIYAKAK